MTRPGIEAAFRMATCSYVSEERDRKESGAYSVEHESALDAVEVEP